MNYTTNWAITTSNCESGQCLACNWNSNPSAYKNYIANDTYIFDISNHNYLMGVRTYNVGDGGVYSAIPIFNDTVTYWAGLHNSPNSPPYTASNVFNTTDIYSTTITAGLNNQQAGSTVSANREQYLFYNLTNKNLDIYIYDDETMSVLLNSKQNASVGLLMDIARFGLQCYRPTTFDDLVIWEDSSTPVLNIESSLENTDNFNSNLLEINYTGAIINVVNESFDCSLVVNGIDNQSTTVNITELNYYNLTFGSVEQDFNISITCSNNEVSSTTQGYIYQVDTISPDIMSSFINNTNYVLLDNIGFYVNFTDTNLYAYNISLLDINDITQENIFAENLSVSFASNYTSRIATSVGTFRFIVEAWDSHTASKIPDYIITKINNKKVRINNRLDLEVLDFDNLTLEKDFDRYRFRLQNKVPKNTVSFSLSKSEGWIYLANSIYEGHFVNFQNNKWLDFETDDLKEITISETEQTIDIVIKLNKAKRDVIFNSIGDLNKESKTYFYTVSTSSSNSTIIELNETNTLLTEIKEVINMLPTAILTVFGLLVWAIGCFYLLSKYEPPYIFFSIVGTVMYVIGILLFPEQGVTENDLLLHNALYIIGIILFFVTAGLTMLSATLILFKKNFETNTEEGDYYSKKR